jgi:2-dehydro-3-deoxy-D-arabinonate dehydratase
MATARRHSFPRVTRRGLIRYDGAEAREASMSVRLFRTTDGPVAEIGGSYFSLESEWDAALACDDLAAWVRAEAEGRPATAAPPRDRLLPPIGRQEVWAAGVTYLRSRTARQEESRHEADFYDRVYSAPRPELFFKASPHRVAGHGQPVRIRRDSRWNVPEPELTLCVSPAGRILGYTIGNDMSSRDIEGENPLYLPQAKVYDGCCGLGPCILAAADPLPPATAISLEVRRAGGVAFSGATDLGKMKRTPQELVEYLLRDNSFPHGCFLLTGTGVIPPNDFTLASGDVIRINIEPIGTLENMVL